MHSLSGVAEGQFGATTRQAAASDVALPIRVLLKSRGNCPSMMQALALQSETSQNPPSGFHVLRLFLKLTSRYDIMMTSYLCRGINGGECTANPERAQVH